MKIGVLGGTFDPIHNGHIKIAKAAFENFNLDKVIFLPTGNPPHKKEKEVTDSLHRFVMCKKAIENEESFQISDIELIRKGYVYTIDTLNLLKPNIKELYYIIGADVLFDLENWRNFNDVTKLCNFIVFKRPGYKDKFNNRIEYMKLKYGDIFKVIEFEEMNISSTYIKENINKTDIIKDMLPKKVYEYIKTKRLYNYEEN